MPSGSTRNSCYLREKHEALSSFPAVRGFLIMICVGIYAILVNDMIIADNLHSAVFSLAAYTVILCFSLFKSGTLAKSIFNAH